MSWNDKQCPICHWVTDVSSTRKTPYGSEGHHVPCERCGPYYITEEALEDMAATLGGDVDRIARVAFGVRRLQRDGEPPFITTDTVERFLKTPLPSVFDQVYNLVRLLGESQAGPGELLEFRSERDFYKIGARSSDGLEYILDQAGQLRFIECANQGADSRGVRLTLNGWDQFDKLQRGRTTSRKAFMAMKFGDETLDKIVTDHLRPAVAQTGFILFRLDDEPRAGLIDDRLRVEIRTARFLIADLSHDNAGAYWEAGYAEGLGMPVIYTCEKEKFKKAKTHFDTNHHLTVVWDERNPADAAERLKATIRATLLDEAKLTD